MTESPTTAIPPRGPGVSMKTDTNSGAAADAGVAVILTVAATHARTNEIPRIRMAAQ
jgi:hypothetical protein